MRTFLSTKAPYRDADGRIIGVLGITRDITARRRAEEDRARALEREQAAREEAEVANRAKDEFLAVLSHELRTPLNAVFGWARMLRGGGLDAETGKRAVEVIERNATAQLQLIEDLLDISRIITGKMRLDVRPVDLAAIVATAVDSVRPAADAKGIRLQTALDPRAGPMLADPDRLQQVVWNLLSNAVKFTPRGGRVEVTVRRVDGHVEIAVSDSGQGIAPAMLPYVFDRFRQGDSSSTRAHGGLGLGLALVRHLAELHGGTVTAHSEGVDQGATFVVSLPITMIRAETEDGEHPAAPPAVATSLARSLSGVRVLAVDDDPDALELCATMLREAGAEVAIAVSAADAIARARDWRPAVLVSDIEMPGEDGYALLRRVQALERETGTRIAAVALTAYGRIEDRVRTLAAGFALHLPKPVDPAELVAVVGALARRR
ncbi:MAG: response regulator [Candidatus Rokubacteria bacterium]|nr:response regulator [Candidatus Rokubacteria bacterium]